MSFNAEESAEWANAVVSMQKMHFSWESKLKQKVGYRICTYWHVMTNSCHCYCVTFIETQYCMPFPFDRFSQQHRTRQRLAKMPTDSSRRHFMRMCPLLSACSFVPSASISQNDAKFFTFYNINSIFSYL